MDSLSQNPYRLEEYLDSLDENQRQNILANKLKEWGKPQDWTLWELKLEHAFSLVLGKPLSAFDSDKEYHVYCSYTFPEHDISIDDLKLEHVKESFGNMMKSLLVQKEIFDKSKSYYSIYPDWVKEAEIESIDDFVLGKDLATIIEKDLVSLEELEQIYCPEEMGEEEFPIIYRCVSGTTLFDAMCTVFFSVGIQGRDLEEKRLIKKESVDKMEFEPDWEEKLKPIEDDRLKGHILCFFNTDDSARCYGWFYQKPEYSYINGLIPLLGGKLIANWNNTEGDHLEFSLWQMDNNKTSS